VKRSGRGVERHGLDCGVGRSANRRQSGTYERSDRGRFGCHGSAEPPGR
jgi:hypothetical protein